MYKMNVDYKYSTNGVNCICVKSGDVVDLPDDIAKSLLSNGRCELEKKAAAPETNGVKVKYNSETNEFEDDEEGSVYNKMLEPVENKSEDKPKKTRKPRSKK